MRLLFDMEHLNNALALASYVFNDDDERRQLQRAVDLTSGLGALYWARADRFTCHIQQGYTPGNLHTLMLLPARGRVGAFLTHFPTRCGAGIE